MIRNLTPHAIVLAPSDDPSIWITYAPEAVTARVSSRPGERATVPGCPVEVVGPTVFGALMGLPDSVDPGDLLVVSLLCAQMAASEAAAVERDLSAGVPPGHLQARLAVLRACVSPGQGPDTIRWTQDDVLCMRCGHASVGQVRAVRALVWAVAR